MHSMSNISKVPSGFLVRKAVGKKLYQKYFGHSRFAGGESEALDAAIAYRDQLLDQAAAEDTGKSLHEVSGTFGITWHCHVNTHRPDVIVHCFRAEAIGEDGVRLVRAWSVDAHGLWKAFEQAVSWQSVAFAGTPMPDSEVIRLFLEFVQHYLEQTRQEENTLLRGGMERAIVDMIANASTPSAVIAAIDWQTVAD